jgi:hypothetical protein
MAIVFHGKAGHMSSVAEDDMEKQIPKERALAIYCTGSGFGMFTGFENVYSTEDTYQTFTDKLVGKGLLKRMD